MREMRMIVLVVLGPVAAMLLLVGMAAIERWQEDGSDTTPEDITVAHRERHLR
jgi:hypothetical protein